MLEKGTKIKLVKEMGMLKNIGEVYSVNSADENTILFSFAEGCMCVMDYDALERHFEIVEPEEEKPAPTVDPDWIEYLITNSKTMIDTTYDKCTIVSLQLPNGFVITESSACVSPENYDEEMGVEICMDKITNKLWELEGYRLQWELYENSDLEEYECDNPDCCGCCLTDKECDECEKTIE